MNAGCGTSFQIEAGSADGTRVLRLSGELDMATAAALHDAVAHLTDGNDFVLDLTALRFVDSAGVRAILQLDSRCRAAGRRLRLVPGPPAVERVFSILGLADRLEFVRREARESTS